MTGSQTGYDESLDAIDSAVFAYSRDGGWQVANVKQVWDVDKWHPGSGSLNDPV